MKIIDLLNKIANEEEVPNEIYYIDKIYQWTGLNYYNNKTDEYLDNHICIEDLEQLVEILEEEKKIPEKIKDKYCSQISKVELAQKYNEIIDYLKSKEK